MEIPRDPELFHALRQEVQGALVLDPSTGGRARLLTLPLLQSVYVECLRLHRSSNTVREIAHHDEAVWGVPEHPASEFWAHRHIKYVESTDEAGNSQRKPEFSMAGRPSSFFPRRLPVCPSRHFAKQEILISLSLIIAKLDIEYVGRTKLDGSLSDRSAKDNDDYAGAEAMPPDRDMRIRGKRLW
ncbi:putative cytochrome p450 family protein [Seiridium unicorne]|uniref:Cytochrome p450 family protein n=1 Tax=Seiridium unicorne TaxID=138068 RepID=A0ABR2USH0_9PEZI